MADYFDVLIVGAGLSGIGSARHLMEKCTDKTFAILESRETIGGTWDLFKYPGVRSDSDMFTLGYEFKPWPHNEGIADGGVICDYIQDAAAEADLESKIQFNRKVVSAEWVDETARWSLQVVNVNTGDIIEMTCTYLMMCTGYYEYEKGYTPEFAGREQFAGAIVHPQHWPDDLDYTGKDVVVIGSGATAVTLVPALAAKAAHVVMLQRSPGYIMSLPTYDPMAAGLSKILPASWVYRFIRGRNLWMGNTIFKLCRRFPDMMRKFMIKQARKRLPDGYDMTHFTPRYMPWDQRLCLVPNGDLFKSIRTGQASVVTDHIETFTSTGLRLKSGRELKADLIVTATGLCMDLTSGIRFKVNGKEYDLSQHHLYKGMMFQDMPNMFRMIGYTNASWTLKTDLIAQYCCRLINHLDEAGASYCVPRVRKTLTPAPLLDMTSGYFKRVQSAMPKGAKEAPWKLYNDYGSDKKLFLHGPLIDDCMEIGTSGAVR